jgi:hypothetical protein
VQRRVSTIAIHECLRPDVHYRAPRWIARKRTPECVYRPDEFIDRADAPIRAESVLTITYNYCGITFRIC